ncbi:hypothetical protein [Pseudoclavibacter sp. CFCC 11306]|uniref:hypothetical protein n=1 Tax=Pseudoclavibacter sp. CFCC 11306 TaxID=1564493 RepID=UPI00139FB048|nr:hypothetical protein [Pseudoclavibacter sp. CFCC 11306]KAB1659019.1 hypothetical protein F8O09_05490 [Pseudoclavibacter sp. CFCC 11306]
MISDLKGLAVDKAGASSGTAVFHSEDGTKTAIGEQTGAKGIVPFIGDTTPPPIPSAPACDGSAGVLVVAWDGGWQNSVEATPPDFAGIIVEVKGTGDWAEEDRTLVAAGSVPIAVAPGDYQVRLRSFDNAHDEALEGAPNVSDPSGMVSVAVEDVPGSAQEAQDVAEQAAEDAVKALTQSQTALDGRQAVMHIDSSRGLVFKNSQVSTVLTVTVMYADLIITDIVTLRETFGQSAYLEWQWKRIDDTDWGTISVADSRLSQGGFAFTITSADVDTKTVFQCILQTD